MGPLKLTHKNISTIHYVRYTLCWSGSFGKCMIIEHYFFLCCCCCHRLFWPHPLKSTIFFQPISSKISLFDVRVSDFFAFFHFILQISKLVHPWKLQNYTTHRVCLDHIMALTLTANNIFVLHLHHDHVEIRRKLKVFEALEHSPVGLLRFFSKITLRREPSMADSSKWEWSPITLQYIILQQSKIMFFKKRSYLPHIINSYTSWLIIFKQTANSLLFSFTKIIHMHNV